MSCTGAPMSGRHTAPIPVRSDAEWDAHVRSTRTAVIIVGSLFALSVGVLIALVLHKIGAF